MGDLHGIVCTLPHLFIFLQLQLESAVLLSELCNQPMVCGNELFLLLGLEQLRFKIQSLEFQIFNSFVLELQLLFVPLRNSLLIPLRDSGVIKFISVAPTAYNHQLLAYSIHLLLHSPQLHR